MGKDIIQIALSLFLKYGFKSVTMDDIAQEMRVSKKTIYAHFPNKESLVMKSSEFHFNMVMNHMNYLALFLMKLVWNNKYMMINFRKRQIKRELDVCR